MLGRGTFAVQPPKQAVKTYVATYVRRLQAAVTQEIVTMKYKTEACAHRPCRRGAECWFYHSEEDRLPLLGYKSQFCKAWHVRADQFLHLATLS